MVVWLYRASADRSVALTSLVYHHWDYWLGRRARLSAAHDTRHRILPDCWLNVRVEIVVAMLKPVQPTCFPSGGDTVGRRCANSAKRIRDHMCSW